MKDVRIEIINRIGMIGRLRGDLVPCIGVEEHTNYIYKGAVVCLTLEELQELDDAVMNDYHASQRYDEASAHLNEVLRRLLSGKFLERQEESQGMPVGLEPVREEPE